MGGMPTPLLPLALAALALQQPAAEKLPLSILYAGNAGTPYSAAWEKFLGEHATRVKFVSGSALKREDLAGFDLLGLQLLAGVDEALRFELVLPVVQLLVASAAREQL